MTRHNKVVNTLNFPEGHSGQVLRFSGQTGETSRPTLLRVGKLLCAAEELEPGTLMIKPVVKIRCTNQHTQLTDLP